MELLEKLKTQTNVTRTDIAELLTSIGAPGEKQTEKLEAVQQLEQINIQGFHISETLPTYGEY